MSFLNPIAWFRWVAEFISQWFHAISWSEAPKAIPAVILSVVLFSTGFIAFSDSAGWRTRLLDRQRDLSLQREDFSTAEIVLRRQLEADPSNSDLVFKFAWVRNAQSHSEEAKVLMRKLLNRRYLPAAKWLYANHILEKKFTDFQGDDLDEVGRVLGFISDREAENLTVKRQYVDYLIYRQRYASAIPLLEELSTVDPLLGLRAAELSRRIGNFEQAERYAETTLEKVVEIHKDNPTNSFLAMNIARNLIFLKRHSDAIRTLRRSVDLVKTTEERRMLTQALGDTIVAYVNYIEETPTNTLKDRVRVLRMLDVALKIAPNNARVVTMVADHVLRSMDEDDEELASVRAALITGSPLGISHFIKGTGALMDEDQSLAELHLELAAEQMPRSGAILNNLAVALAMKSEPDYERALEVANAAIEHVATPTPHFYETRGQILFRMGSFREAIADLERALAAPNLKLKAHQMLADCYGRVGDKELAELHQEAADRFDEEAEGESNGDQPELPGGSSADESSDSDESS